MLGSSSGYWQPSPPPTTVPLLCLCINKGPTGDSQTDSHLSTQSLTHLFLCGAQAGRPGWRGPGLVLEP